MVQQILERNTNNDAVKFSSQVFWKKTIWTLTLNQFFRGDSECKPLKFLFLVEKKMEHFKKLHSLICIQVGILNYLTFHIRETSISFLMRNSRVQITCCYNK